MSGTKKDDRSKEETGKSSPVSGAGLGMLSMIKNKKIMTVIGGILIVVGIAGMVAVGSTCLAPYLAEDFHGPIKEKGFKWESMYLCS